MEASTMKTVCAGPWKVIDEWERLSKVIIPSGPPAPASPPLHLCPGRACIRGSPLLEMCPCTRQSIVLNVTQHLSWNLLSLLAVGWLCATSLFLDVRRQTTVSAINRRVSWCPPRPAIILIHVLPGFMLLYLPHYNVLTYQLIGL